MPEIMSAEEYGFNLMKIADEEHDGSVLADRFASCTTSRDSAIIEKCKEAIQNVINKCGDIHENKVEVTLTGSDLGRIADALDSVLSDINGGK